MGVIANPKTNEINIRFAAPFLISKIKVKIIAITMQLVPSSRPWLIKQKKDNECYKN